jgi:C-terminal processing protease CtpA/Prc
VTPPTEEKPATPPAAAETKKKPEPTPVKIVFEGIRDRLTLLPLGLNAEEPIISSDGKTLLFAARAANQQSLYTYDLDELAKEPPVARQLTSTPGRKSNYVFGADNKEVFYLENGAVKTITVETRTPKAIAVTAPMQIDFDVEKKVVFEEAWETLNRRFYDAKFNGHDWLKLHDEWAPYIAGVRTSDELRRDINLLIGELNSSHSGINRPMGPGSGPQPVQVGNLGLRFDREAYEGGKGLIVREVIALGPAAIEGSIKPGDRLVSVSGEEVGTKNLDGMLEDTVGKRVVLGVETNGKARDAVVRPVSSTAAVGLLYRQWVESRRALVDRVSGGKIGYVHLADMGDASLQQLYIDLDAQNEAKQGVVVDVRNNNGGYINGYALDVFTRKNYLMMTPRDLTPVPSRQNLGQRALGVPTVLVTNESSLSDAEDFTEGYRSLKLGKVVGEPTAGWIIFTGAQQLIDGSSVRVPGWRIQDLQGQTMEMHPRPVDVEVERPLGETETGSDAQLERAVKELMNTQ